tara:strand:+ start:493 stop:906 length:414 start_codon:yes stop_codon:yes gene_type:complete
MNQVIIFTNESGNVSICVPTGDLPIETVQAKDIPSGVQSFIVSQSSLPTSDQDFFDAWEQVQGVVSVSLAKAKELTKKRLRIEREPLFAALDIAFQRAFETGADTSAIVAEKQRLRDLTKLPDGCTTLDELRLLKAA